MTTAQDALKAFQDARKTDTITVDLNYLIQREQLEIAAEKEIEANRVASEAEYSTAQTNRLKSIQDSLKALGYACDNSKADWDKLYNKPRIFGTNWQAQATYQKSISPNADYFCNHAYNILYNNYMIGNKYNPGDTFVFDGVLYEVIQPHISQLDWVPSTTASLYKKAVLANEILAWVQPLGAHDAYKKGAKVIYKGSTYESLIDANVWSPEDYPQGWKKI